MCRAQCSQFNCQEFRKFANVYEFEHVTSSPRFPRSNGKVENAIKTCKKLMLKSLESGSDPFLALLEWRNCPSEQLSLSPVQLLVGRRTRTPMPIAGTQLSTPTAPTAKSALTDAKRRQAIYYNRSTILRMSRRLASACLYCYCDVARTHAPSRHT